MAGIVNDNIVYPIVELIKRQVRNSVSTTNNAAIALEGEPAVTLYRTDSRDPERVTGAELRYDSGFVVDVYLKFGDEWRLEQVTTSTLDADGIPLLTYNIRLNYDSTGLLTGTSVYRID